MMKISVKLSWFTKVRELLEKMDVGLDLNFFDDESIQMMRILGSLLTLGIAFATNDRYGPGWNWLINLTFFQCIIPVFLGNFGSEMMVNLNPLLVHLMVLLGVTLSSLSALITAGNSSDQDQIESLMLGQFEPIKETAVDYFLRNFSGNETGASVIWPQRLKVGSKKGKNPHILEDSSSPCQHSSGIMAKVIVRVINNGTLVHEHSHELNKPEYQGDLRSSPAAVYVGRNVEDYESFDDGAVLIQRAEPTLTRSIKK